MAKIQWPSFKYPQSHVVRLGRVHIIWDKLELVVRRVFEAPTNVGAACRLFLSDRSRRWLSIYLIHVMKGLYEFIWNICAIINQAIPKIWSSVYSIRGRVRCKAAGQGSRCLFRILVWSLWNYAPKRNSWEQHSSCHQIRDGRVLMWQRFSR